MVWEFYLLFFVVSVFAGYIIAWLARDELIIGREWFQRITILFFVVGIGCSIFGFDVEAIVCSFIVVISWIAYFKSKDKKWTGKKN